MVFSLRFLTCFIFASASHALFAGAKDYLMKPEDVESFRELVCTRFLNGGRGAAGQADVMIRMDWERKRFEYFVQDKSGAFKKLADAPATLAYADEKWVALSGNWDTSEAWDQKIRLDRQKFNRTRVVPPKPKRSAVSDDLYTLDFDNEGYFKDEAHIKDAEGKQVVVLIKVSGDSAVESYCRIK